MSELKPCPFCGSKALTNIFLDCEDIENLPTNVIDDYEPEVTCENERCIYGWWLSPKDWNTRPIEDALNARISELEAAQRWIPVSERLPEDGEIVWLWDGNNLGMGYYLIFSGCFMDRDTPLRSIKPTHWMPLPQPPEVQE